MRPDDLPVVIDLTVAAFGRGERGERIRDSLLRSYGSGIVMKYEHGYVGEIDGRIVCKAQALDLRARLGAVTLRTCGLNAVVTDPSVRNASLFLPLVRYARKAIVDAGFDIALGFTEHRGIFGLVGATTVAARYAWQVEAKDIPWQAGATEGFRGAEFPDVERIVALVAATNGPRALSLVRSADLWHELDWEHRPDELWLGEGDSIYLGLRTLDTIEVRDIGVQDDRGYTRALVFLGELARAKGIARITGDLPPNHPLVEHSRRFGGKSNVSFVEGTGCMGAILNLETFLTAITPELERRYRTLNAPAGLRFQYVDDAGVHELRLGDVDDARAATLRLRGSRALLLRLVLGTFPPHELLASEQGASVEAIGIDTAEAMGALFPLQHPFVGIADRF